MILLRHYINLQCHHWYWSLLPIVMVASLTSWCVGQTTASPPVAFSVLETDDEPLPPQPVSATASQPEPSAEDTQHLNEFLTSLALEHMPHEFADDKDWGRQDERWDGVDIRRDGLKLRTHRKKKKVNHGTWQKYSASLIDPEHQFRIRIENATVLDDGSSKFDIACRARLKLDGRQSKWLKGVQLYSVGVDGHATVRLTTSVRLKTTLDFSHFPPDVIINPLITDAQIDIEDFRLDHVGKAGGEIAQQISRRVRKKLEQKAAEKEVNLVAKLNKKIDDNREKLRLSMHDSLVKQWSEKTGLPSPGGK